jgi:hypothetical protein
MAISFDDTRWKKIQADSQKWWAGELKRPLVQVRLDGRDPGRTMPILPPFDMVDGAFADFTSFFDFSIPAEQIIDRWDYSLCSTEFIADGFPMIWPNFGAGVTAAFLGATLENTADSTWFHYDGKEPIEKLSLKFDPGNKWFRRVCDIVQAAVNRWQGSVQACFTDLGGVLDVLSSFVGPEAIMFAMFDKHLEVKRLISEIHAAWWTYYEEFAKITQPTNPGYSAMGWIFANRPHYMLQCDFAFMLSPAMFDEFVKPELAASAAMLPNAFYHLDGSGQLAHLDSILEIENIRGIQWVPGVGQPDVSQWPDVYRKIRNAGKLVQIFDFQSPHGIKIMDIIADQIGSLEGFVFMISQRMSQKDHVLAMLEKHRVL